MRENDKAPLEASQGEIHLPRMGLLDRSDCVKLLSPEPPPPLLHEAMKTTSVAMICRNFTVLP